MSNYYLFTINRYDNDIDFVLKHEKIFTANEFEVIIFDACKKIISKLDIYTKELDTYTENYRGQIIQILITEYDFQIIEYQAMASINSDTNILEIDQNDIL